MPTRAFERSRSERLEDIVAWGQKAAGFIARMQLGEFARDEKTLIAVSKCVEVVGEAAAQLLKAFPEVQIEHPDLELAAARAMRNRLSHGYFDIDPQVLWDTATIDLPKIVRAAPNALAPEARGG
jgi:uncharacterized protein with HEPN domain